jgi:hypothetical protein
MNGANSFEPSAPQTFQLLASLFESLFGLQELVIARQL